MRDVEEPPDTRRLYAPMLAAGRTVNARAGGAVRLALFRDRHGEACAVGFTSAEALERVLGTTKYEAWPLGRACLRELADARGARRVLVDPVFAAAVVSDGEPESAHVAEPAAPVPSTGSSRRVDPQVAGAQVLRHGVRLPEIDLGGGQAIAYRPGADALIADAARIALPLIDQPR